MKKTLTYLIAATAFLLVSAAVMAQGGANPMVGSSHGYKVTPGDGSNTFAWSLAVGNGTITTATTGDSINITWNTAGTDTIIFTETDVVTGCQTVKELEVIIQPNTFDVTISDSTIACNSADGAINFTGTDTTTLISFTVDTLGVNWDHDWEIVFTLTSAATLANVTGSAGTLSGAGPYTLTDIPGSTPSVDITVEVTGDAFTQQTVVMDITSATELKYNTPALGNANWQSTSVINAIPNTSDITTD